MSIQGGTSRWALLVAMMLLAAPPGLAAADFRLPFDGRWFVMQGGDTLNVNQHMAVRSQWYGIDFAKVGAPAGRSLTKGEGRALEDFYSWDEPVLSPVDGEVTTIVDELPDNPFGTRDERNPAGNHVVIKAAGDRYVFLAHFRRGSIEVKPGQHVVLGQRLGKCGNSGNSDFPHIHMHVQDAAAFGEGTGQNVVFSRIDVEMNGRRFEAVDWPLIRGLFVSNH